MKTKRNTTVFFLSVILALSACQTEKTIYVPENNNITFMETGASYLLKGDDIVIPLVRGIAEKAVSLEIKLEDKMGIYVLKTPTVQFADGVFVSEIRLGYDLNMLLPTVDYTFSLSFDKKEMSAVGINSFQGSAMMPLEYEACGKVSVKNSFISSRLSEKTFLLKKAKFTTNYYQIEKLYGSATNFEFYVDGAYFVTRTPPKSNKWNSDPLIEIASAANHDSYGAMTGWINPDTGHCTITDPNEDGSLKIGSSIGFDIYWTVSAGYFGWYTESLVVTELD